jgi:hypothetical protein
VIAAGRRPQLIDIARWRRNVHTGQWNALGAAVGASGVGRHVYRLGSPDHRCWLEAAVLVRLFRFARPRPARRRGATLNLPRPARRPLVGLVVASLVVAPSLFAPLVPAASADAVAAPSCASEAADEVAASALAAACGRRVEVGSARSYFTTVFAEPDGRLVLESAVVPQRTRRADGSWTPVDLTLARGSDGLVRPAASVLRWRSRPAAPVRW